MDPTEPGEPRDHRDETPEVGPTLVSTGRATPTPRARLTLETLPSDLAFDDLAMDPLLASAPRLDCGGRRVPSLGGIPLLRKIGQGGMGAVYHALHPRLGTEVAVKVLPLHLSGRDPGLAQRFVREARLAARIDSPHLVRVLDVDEEGPMLYIVMELVRGISAREFMEQAGEFGIPEADALDLVMAATQGLAAAHAHGIVHRDVKPDNILIPLDADGLPLIQDARLADLGLARQDDLSRDITATQNTMGTPGYMAPEQATRIKEAGKPADVFGMGATLHALLSGKAPFSGSSAIQAILATIQDPYEPIRGERPDVSIAASDLLERSLAKDPADRFSDASELLDALRYVRGGAPDWTPLQQTRDRRTLRRRTAAAAAIAIVVTLVVVGAMMIAAPGADDEHPEPESWRLAEELTLDLGDGIGLAAVLVPAGCFLMGSTADELGSSADERPRREIEIARPFYVGRHEVTQVQWERVMGENPSRWVDGLAPVENVSWDMALDFCRRLSDVSGCVVDLPTEAEWEYACRAGSASVFAGADTLGSVDANVQGHFTYGGAPRGPARGRTTKSGTFGANAWGLHDLHGNVWEWCRDGYTEDAYHTLSVSDPLAPPIGDHRVMRGGSWRYGALFARAAARFWMPAFYRGPDAGLRIVVRPEIP